MDNKTREEMEQVRKLLKAAIAKTVPDPHRIGDGQSEALVLEIRESLKDFWPLGWDFRIRVEQCDCLHVEGAKGCNLADETYIGIWIGPEGAGHV